MLYRCTKDDVPFTMYHLPCTIYPFGGPDEFLIRGEERRTMRSVTGAAEQRLTRALIQAVELAGVEPASKQGLYMLSTRLSWPSFSSDSKTQATNYRLIC